MFTIIANAMAVRIGSTAIRFARCMERLCSAMRRTRRVCACVSLCTLMKIREAGFAGSVLARRHLACDIAEALLRRQFLKTATQRVAYASPRKRGEVKGETRKMRGGEAYCATVLQFEARFSAARSDSAKTV
jgi:hypothetical protein